MQKLSFAEIKSEKQNTAIFCFCKLLQGTLLHFDKEHARDYPHIAYALVKDAFEKKAYHFKHPIIQVMKIFSQPNLSHKRHAEQLLDELQKTSHQLLATPLLSKRSNERLKDPKRRQNRSPQLRHPRLETRQVLCERL